MFFIISLSGNISLEALAIVFLVINPGWVLLSVNQRKLKMMKVDKKPNDAINIRLWNVIFACIFTMIFTFVYDFYFGTSNLLNAVYASFDHFSWLILIGIGTFFSFVFYVRALGIGKASVTQAVRASTVLFAIPFSIMLSYFNIIPPFTTDPVMILIKIIGITLVILGIVSYALTLVRAYIFIKAKPGFN